jgi:hypothetical protein
MPATGENRLRDDITGNDPHDAYVPTARRIEQKWIKHLIATWGTWATGGVGYYLMDNEPSIWFRPIATSIPSVRMRTNIATRSSRNPRASRRSIPARRSWRPRNGAGTDISTAAMTSNMPPRTAGTVFPTVRTRKAGWITFRGC